MVLLGSSSNQRFAAQTHMSNQQDKTFWTKLKVRVWTHGLKMLKFLFAVL